MEIELRHPGDWLGRRREESGCRLQDGWCAALRGSPGLEGGDEEGSPGGGVEVPGAWVADAQQEPRRGSGLSQESE